MIDRTVECNTLRQQYDMLNYEMRNVDNNIYNLKIEYVKLKKMQYYKQEKFN